MSKNRMLNTRFWSDSWIADVLEPLDRYMLLYLMLNERTNLCGVYELPIRHIANETGIEKEKVSEILNRLEPKVYYRNGWVVVVNTIKHQNYKNSKIAAGIQREICHAPADLVTLIAIPSDFIVDLTCPVDETTVNTVDNYDSSMSHTRHITPNLTKPNLTKPNLTERGKPRGFDKSKTLNKKIYAQAVQADREQQERIAHSQSRAGPGYNAFASAGEMLKIKRFTKNEGES